DQKIATGDEMDTYEGRVLEHAVRGEQDEVAHLFPYAIMVTLFGEEAAQPLLGDVRRNRPRIAALAGYEERFFIEVTGEDLNGSLETVAGRLFEQQHRDAICLLPGSAADDPDADARVLIDPLANRLDGHP